MCYDNKRDGRTVHLALIREDDFPTAAWWVNCQGFLEALLDVGAPYTLGVILQGFVKSISQLLTPTPRGGSRHPLRRRGGMSERGSKSKEWVKSRELGRLLAAEGGRGFNEKRGCLYDIQSWDEDGGSDESGCGEKKKKEINVKP